MRQTSPSNALTALQCFPVHISRLHVCQSVIQIHLDGGLWSSTGCPGSQGLACFVEERQARGQEASAICDVQPENSWAPPQHNAGMRPFADPRFTSTN